MAEQSIINFIKQQLNKGDSISTIKSYLRKSGYPTPKINEAINSVYSRKTVSPYIPIMVVTGVVIVLLLIIFFYYNANKKPPEPSKFDLIGETIITEQGSQISFSKKFSNFDEKQIITIDHELIDVKKVKAIASKKESGTLTELLGKTSIDITEDIPAGIYVLKSTAVQNNKKDIATLRIEVRAVSKKLTCSDKIKNQGETGIDCGGPCEPCEECLESCDDNNECTADICSASTNFTCTHETIIPCCGNEICEENENCSLDCEKTNITLTEQPLPSQVEQKTTEPNIKKKVGVIKNKVLKDPTHVQSCDKLEKQSYKDYCFSEVAKSLDNYKICSSIADSYKKDECYIDYMINNDDYSLCDEIKDEQLKESCNLLS